MAKNDVDKRQPQEPTSVAGAPPRAQETSPPVPRPERTLTRNEFETLRARLQKKFH